MAVGNLGGEEVDVDRFNEELENRNEELGVVNNDLMNLLASVERVIRHGTCRFPGDLIAGLRVSGVLHCRT